MIAMVPLLVITHPAIGASSDSDAAKGIRIRSQLDGFGGSTQNYDRINVVERRPNRGDGMLRDARSYFTMGSLHGFGGSGGDGGGGGRFISARTSKEQETDDKEGDCSGQEGNPVVLYTGNKVEPEMDFASNGEMGLYLQRTYNHHWSATGLFGRHWLSNLDYSLVYSDAQNILWAQRPDGRRIKFLLDPGSSRWYEDKAQPVAYISRDGNGILTLYNEDRGVEIYNAEGYITERRNEQGVKWSFVYNNRYLQSVTHSSGRKIILGWSNGQLAQVTDPAGNVYRYTYTANAFGTGTARLASTTLPGEPATTISYHYEDSRFPGALTGKSFNGTRYSTFAYDANRRATLTEHAGHVERYTFSYAVQRTEQVMPPPAPVQPGRPTSGGAEPEAPWCEPGIGGEICYVPRSLPGAPILMASNAARLPVGAVASAQPTKERAAAIHVTTNNPLGRRTTVAYDDGKQISVTGDASPRCPASFKEASYDANGYPDLVHDFANNLTDYDYNARGFLLKRVEAVGDSAERTTHWEWDAASNRLLKVTVVGDLQTSYTYDGRGNVATITSRNLSSNGQSQQSRVLHFTYTYHSNGLKASVKTDGPLAQDDITETYSAQGDLLTVRNALGHQVTYSDYNGLGLPGKITGSNGEMVEMTYDGRGRMTTQRQHIDNTSWATSSTTFDGAGNVARITHPDGVTTRFSYDAARRLLQEVRPMGDGTYAWTHYSHDNASNVTRTEVRHTDYPMGSAVVGDINGITHDDQWNWFVRGWACSTGSNASIQVDGYAEGGTYLGSTQANRASESEVASVCQASGSAYRFQLPITLAHRQQLGGKRVTVYGVSPQGAAHNTALASSSAYAIPEAPVLGDINRVVYDDMWNAFVEGWACSVGVDTPINVHLYVGGPAGSGTYTLGGKANLASEAAISNACQSRGSTHRFRLPLDYGNRVAHHDKPIFIHGISPAGGANLLINGSGGHRVPAATLSAEMLSFSASPGIITNGEGTTLSAQVRNTGNVVWHDNTYLAWGFIHLTENMPLPRPVKPGEVVTFSRTIYPENPGNGGRYFEYSAQMASSGSAWGPRSTTGVTVHNNLPICTGRLCEDPRSVEPGVTLEAKQGEH